MSAPAWLSRLLFVVAGFCFLFAAVTTLGGDVLDGSAAAWFYGGLAAVALGAAAGA